MRKKRNKSIGILGGMGPDASIYFYKILIEKARRDFSVVKNEDYPDIILHSIPVPDFIIDQNRVDEALTLLKESTKHIAPFCSVLSIACNTAHLLLDELQSITDTPFISMIDEVVKSVYQAGYKRVGLLATPTTFRSRLYQNAFDRLNGAKVFVPIPSEIEELGSIVMATVGGDFSKTSVRVKAIADNLVTQGVEVIILGCTELPLVFPKNYRIPIISSLYTLATPCLHHYYQR